MVIGLNQSEKKQKGNEIEAEVARLLPACRHADYTDFYDLEFNGVLIEVKSAELRIHKRQGALTSGRFVLSKEQHKRLVEKQGWYAFVLTKAGKMLDLVFVNGEDVTLNHFGKTFYFVSQNVLYQGLTVQEFLQNFLEEKA